MGAGDKLRSSLARRRRPLHSVVKRMKFFACVFWEERRRRRRAVGAAVAEPNTKLNEISTPFVWRGRRVHDKGCCLFPHFASPTKPRTRPSLLSPNPIHHDHHHLDTTAVHSLPGQTSPAPVSGARLHLPQLFSPFPLPPLSSTPPALLARYSVHHLPHSCLSGHSVFSRQRYRESLCDRRPFSPAFFFPFPS